MARRHTVVFSGGSNVTLRVGSAAIRVDELDACPKTDRFRSVLEIAGQQRAGALAPKYQASKVLASGFQNLPQWD